MRNLPSSLHSTSLQMKDRNWRHFSLANRLKEALGPTNSCFVSLHSSPRSGNACMLPRVTWHVQRRGHCLFALGRKCQRPRFEVALSAKLEISLGPSVMEERGCVGCSSATALFAVPRAFLFVPVDGIPGSRLFPNTSSASGGKRNLCWVKAGDFVDDIWERTNLTAKPLQG